jgi:hypothetical protein
MATIEKRESADGVRYRVRVRRIGDKPRTRTFKRKTDAELWANKVESDLGHSVYVPTTADRRRTRSGNDNYIAGAFGESRRPYRRNSFASSDGGRTRRAPLTLVS